MTSGERLYAGDIFILSAPTDHARSSAWRADAGRGFCAARSQTIHETQDAGRGRGDSRKLKPQFIHHPDCKRLIPQIMAEHGVDLDKLYFDVPRLRSAYPSHFLSSGIAYAFHPHRDTWYSAPMCQLNWWLPIYPLEPDNAMGFYPALLRRGGREQLGDLQLLRVEYQEPGDRGAARQERHARAAEGAAGARASHRALSAAARRHHRLLRRAAARDRAQHDRRGALQHRLPHRALRRRRRAPRRAQCRLALHRARPCATICARPISRTCLRRRSRSTTTAPRRVGPGALLRRQARECSRAAGVKAWAATVPNTPFQGRRQQDKRAPAVFEIGRRLREPRRGCTREMWFGQKRRDGLDRLSATHGQMMAAQTRIEALSWIST